MKTAILSIFPLLCLPAEAARTISLGSSYGYGFGLAKPNDTSLGTYGARFAGYIGANFTNAAVPGSLLTSIYQPFLGLQPQLNYITPDVTIVTITAGGNDMGYIACCGQTATNTSLTVRDCSPGANATMVQKRYVTAVNKVYQKLKDVGASNVDKIPIYMVTYVKLFANYTVVDTAEIPQNQSVVNNLNGVYFDPLRLASIAAYKQLKKTIPSVRLVDMSLLSANNSIDAAANVGGPWTNGASNFTQNATAGFHPNAEGHHQTARYLVKAMTGRFPRN